MAGGTGFAVTAVSAAQLSLDWVDNSDGSAAFEVERKTTAIGSYSQIAATAVGATSYVDATVGTGTTYCYRVRASNSSGDSAYSNEACGSVSTTFDITVAKAGNGDGRVISAPSGIDCGGDCVQSFPAGTVVTLTASALSGTFGGWSGGGCSGTAPCVMIGNTPVTVTASFGLDGAAPTVSITSPSAGATVSGSVDVGVATSDNTVVTRVELWVDDVLVATGTAAPWSLAWDSAAAASGSHTLRARAYDAAGNVGVSAPLLVTIANGLANDAEIVTVSAPDTAVVTQTFSVTVVLRNTGTTTWTPGSYALASTNGKRPTRVALPSSVPPGALVTLKFNVRAPLASSLTLTYRMVQDGDLWFGESLSERVTLRWNTAF
jgi:hypothetical protein